MAMRSRDEGKTQPVSVFSGRHDRRKVTDWVYEELKSAIVDLRLAPGDPLREATLAEQLGVSKTPIREALTRLEQEGLVETTSLRTPPPGRRRSRCRMRTVTASAAYAARAASSRRAMTRPAWPR
jgi:DNA-binding GntR family transcriptional regulator